MKVDEILEKKLTIWSNDTNCGLKTIWYENLKLPIAKTKLKGYDQVHMTR